MDPEVRIPEADAKRLSRLGLEPAAAGVIDPEEERNQQHSKDEEK